MQLQLVTTLIFDWWEEGAILRVEWRYACRDSGEQCVVTPGIPEMQSLLADSLVLTQRVRDYTEHPLIPMHSVMYLLC